MRVTLVSALTGTRLVQYAVFQGAWRRGRVPQRLGPVSLRFVSACFACVLPSSQFGPARAWFTTLCFRVPGAVDVCRSGQAPSFPGADTMHWVCQANACTAGSSHIAAAPTFTYNYFFSNANTSQWSVAVLDIGFACVSASVLGTGCDRAEHYRAGPAKRHSMARGHGACTDAADGHTIGHIVHGRGYPPFEVGTAKCERT